MSFLRKETNPIMDKLILGIPYSGCEFTSEVPFTREDEVVAFAFGCELAGQKTTMFMQDNGVLLSLDALVGLFCTYEVFAALEVHSRTDLHHKLTGYLMQEIRPLFQEVKP